MLKIFKSKTIVFMLAAGIVPLLDLLGGVDIVGFLEPKVCVEGVDCASLMTNINQAYASFIAIVGVGLRFVTTQPLSEK